VLSGAELAEQMGVTAPFNFDREGAASTRLQAQLNALEKLAAAETAAIHDPRAWTQAALASSAGVQPSVDFAPCENVKLAEVLRALADAGVVLPVREFLSLTVKAASEEMVRAVTSELDGVFSKLASDPDIGTALETNAFFPASAAAAPVRVWAEKVAMTHSVRPHAVEKRAYQAALRDVRTFERVKESGTGSTASAALARQYAFYKIAAYASLNEKYGNCWLTANHCVLQNYVT
jgi:hypothetical protein